MPKVKTPATPNGALPQQVVAIPAMELREATFTLIGTSPLIVHNWSEKAKRQLREKHAKAARQGREKRDPEAEFQSSLYKISDKVHGFPVRAFKRAAGDAWTHVEGLRKGIILGSFHIINGVSSKDGDLLPLEYSDLRKREDMVRVSMGAADLRYRGEYIGWKVNVTVRYNVRVISLEQILNICNVAGFAKGIGEMRPELGGSNGMFAVQEKER